MPYLRSKAYLNSYGCRMIHLARELLVVSRLFLAWVCLHELARRLRKVITVLRQQGNELLNV